MMKVLMINSVCGIRSTGRICTDLAEVLEKEEALVIATSYFSFKLNSGASMSEDQAKQMKMMTNFMTIFIGVASLTLSTGIAIYWIINSGFTILQNLWVKRRKA